MRQDIKFLLPIVVSRKSLQTFSLLWHFNNFKEFCEHLYFLDQFQKSFRNSCISCLWFNGIFLILPIFPHYYIFCISKDLFYFPLDTFASSWKLRVRWNYLTCFRNIPALQLGLGNKTTETSCCSYSMQVVFWEVLTIQTSTILHQYNSYSLYNCRMLHLGMLN